MESRTWFIAASAAVLLAIAVIATFSLQDRDGSKGRHEKVTFAVSYDPSSAVIFVAREKGFFRDEGIEVLLDMHTTGSAALKSMEDGNADLATVADTAFMFAGMDGKKVRCVTSIADSEKHHRVIALKSSGIRKPEDLRGKRIGVPVRTTGEFFLYSFLLFNGISREDVKLVDMQPEQMLAGLEQKTVDAVAVWFPMVTILLKKFGNRAVVYEDYNYLMTWNLAARESFIKTKPDLIKKILKALLQAEKFISREPDESADITSLASSSDEEVLRQNWGNYHFGLQLNEALLINLEDQARWALKVYYRGRKTIPDFTDYIYTDGLMAVEPSAVGIRGGPVP